MICLECNKTVEILRCTNIEMVFLIANSDEMSLTTIISKSVNESLVYRIITL